MALSLVVVECWSLFHAVEAVLSLSPDLKRSAIPFLPTIEPSMLLTPVPAPPVPFSTGAAVVEVAVVGRSVELMLDFESSSGPTRLAESRLRPPASDEVFPSAPALTAFSVASPDPIDTR